MSKIYGIGDEEEVVADMPNIINERIKAELEEIKAEIQNLPTNNFLGMIPKGEAIYILDKHIKEIDNDNKSQFGR